MRSEPWAEDKAPRAAKASVEVSTAAWTAEEVKAVGVKWVGQVEVDEDMAAEQAVQ